MELKPNDWQHWDPIESDIGLWEAIKIVASDDPLFLVSQLAALVVLGGLSFAVWWWL